jgi:predicted phosphodiesterase
MALFPPTFQIVSDLHLETPVAAPQYAEFKLSVEADNILLLGDIGLTTEPRLFTWLRKLLEDNPASRIFYIMGNHEAYRNTHEDSVGD